MIVEQEYRTGAAGCWASMVCTSRIKRGRKDLRFIPKVFLIDADEVS
jgi:hypothetical protein